MIATDRQRRHSRAGAAILVLLAGATLASAWYWVRLGIPVAIAAASSGRIACVSYAPYRKAGESPFTLGYRVAPERIDEDLKALSRHFACVSTIVARYSVEISREEAFPRDHASVLSCKFAHKPLQPSEG